MALALPASGLADKPEGKGKGKGHHESDEGGGARAAGFASAQRESARGFFAESYGRGHCPPGLAKKLAVGTALVVDAIEGLVN